MAIKKQISYFNTFIVKGDVDSPSINWHVEESRIKGDFNADTVDLGVQAHIADKNYRTLSCWECFEAEGKMCHDENYASMMKVTGSSNFGHGVCCKPDYNGEHCNNDSDHECPEPAKITDASSPLKDVLGSGELNYRMVAFCPGIN